MTVRWLERKEPIHQQYHSFANVKNCQIEKAAPAKLNAIFNGNFKTCQMISGYTFFIVVILKNNLTYSTIFESTDRLARGEN